MRFAKPLLAAALIASLAGGIIATLPRAGAKAAATAPAGAPLAISLPRGATYAYRVTWQGETRAAVTGDASVSGRVDLDAELVLRSLGGKDGVHLVAARLEELRRHELVIGGAAALPDRAAAIDVFAASEAFAEIEAGGRVRAIYFGEAAPPLFRHVMQRLLASLDTTLEAAPVYGAEEAGPSGRARVRYARTGALTLLRTREEYTDLTGLPASARASTTQSLDAHGVVTLDPAGHVRAIEDTEALTVLGADGALLMTSSSRFALELLRVGAETSDVHAVETTELDRVGPSDLPADADLEHRMLEAQVGYMTEERLHVGLLQYAHTGKMPQQRGWMVRAAGLLELDPTACEGLLAVLASSPPRGKALALELLAGAGTTAAQATMRAIVERSVGQMDDELRLQLVQRFSLLARPDSASVDLVGRIYNGASGASRDLRYASAYTLGALARALVASDDLAGAHAVDLVLRLDLERASSAEERRHLVTALGAIGLEANVALLARHAKDAAPEVRAAAAEALRRPASKEARAALLALLDDAEDAVKRAAVGALSRQPLSRPDLAAVRARVASGALSSSHDRSLLQLLATHATERAEVIAIAELLLARSEDPRKSAELRRFLAGV